MHHHHHHYSSRPPIHHPPPPRPSPPPPPPPEAYEPEPTTGMPRCYFCGKMIAREEDVRKTEHQLGHGYTTLVMICPGCRSQKERGEGPWAGVKTRKLIGIVVLCIGVLVAIIGHINESAWEKRWLEGKASISSGPPVGFFMIGGGWMAAVFGLAMIFNKATVTSATERSTHGTQE